MKNIGESFRIAIFLLLALFAGESGAIYVVKLSSIDEDLLPNTVDFYIYNNTSVPLSIDGGFNLPNLPRAVAPHSVGATRGLDSKDRSKNDGTFVVSLGKDGETSSFAVWGHSNWIHTVNRWDILWTLYSVSGDWNTSNHEVCYCGAVNLISRYDDGYVNQIWGSKYVVTLFIVFPDDQNGKRAKDLRPAKIMLVANENNGKANRFFRGVNTGMPWSPSRP